MKKILVAVSAIAVAAVMAAGLAGMFDTSAPSVHASRLAGISGAGATGIQIQNLDASMSATMVAEFYKQGSTGSPVPITISGVPAGGAANLFLPLQDELSNGAYAAIVSADRQIAAIARTDWFSSGGAAIYSNVIPGSSVALPLAVIDYNSQTSLVSIQNTDTSQTATVEVILYAAGSTDPVVTENYNINPGTSITLDLGKDSAFLGVPDNTPSGFLGSMTVNSATPVGVQSFVDITSSAMAVYAFEGVPAENASDKLYAPLIRRRFFGYDTGISVVNPNASAVQATATYNGAIGDCAGQTYTQGPVEIAGGSSFVFYQGPVPENGLPDNCVGSAVIESTGGNVLAIVNDSLNFVEQSAAYNAVSGAQGALKVALPLARNQHIDSLKATTGIQVMNISESDTANVEIGFAEENGAALQGCGAACSATVAPLGSANFYPGANGLNVMPPGTYGSAVVTSDQPVVVIVNDASTIGAMDAATYNGIKADL